MTKPSLNDWLRQLERHHPKEIDLGLDRVGQVAAALNLLAPDVPVITVAGTNGKGSTVAVLEALINASGRSAGVFSSPHLFRFNERIRIGGREASDAAIIDAFERIEHARGEVSLTYFEFSTLAALIIFREAPVDVLVLEVGLGGRLDAVNIIDATVAVITSIALDHQDWLGTTRNAIAVEKAGILRPDTPVVVADPDPPESLLAEIRRIGAQPVCQFGSEFGVESGAELGTSVEQEGAAYIQSPTGRQRRFRPLPSCGLLPVNLTAGLQAFELLGISLPEEGVLRALSELQLTGRCQQFTMAGIHYVFDVAHNPAAVAVLAEHVRCLPLADGGRAIAVFSAMADKDIAQMISNIGDCVDVWCIADQAENPRAAASQTLAKLLQQAGKSAVTIDDNLMEAARSAHNLARPGDVVVVFGSFFTVAGVLPLIESRQLECEAV